MKSLWSFASKDILELSVQQGGQGTPRCSGKRQFVWEKVIKVTFAKEKMQTMNHTTFYFDLNYPTWWTSAIPDAVLTRPSPSGVPSVLLKWNKCNMRLFLLFYFIYFSFFVLPVEASVKQTDKEEEVRRGAGGPAVRWRTEGDHQSQEDQCERSQRACSTAVCGEKTHTHTHF